MCAYVYELTTVCVEEHIHEAMIDTPPPPPHGVMIYEPSDYYTTIIEDYGLHRAYSVNAPCTSSLRPDGYVDLLSSEDHSKYRRAVGMIQWQSPIRPDISYAIKRVRVT